MIKDDPAKTGEHLVMLSKRYSSIFKPYVPKSSFKIFMLVYLSFKINCTMLLTVSNSIAEGKLFNSWNIHPSIFSIEIETMVYLRTIV